MMGIVDDLMLAVGGAYLVLAVLAVGHRAFGVVLRAIARTEITRSVKAAVAAMPYSSISTPEATARPSPEVGSLQPRERVEMMLRHIVSDNLITRDELDRFYLLLLDEYAERPIAALDALEKLSSDKDKKVAELMSATVEWSSIVEKDRRYIQWLQQAGRPTRRAYPILSELVARRLYLYMHELSTALTLASADVRRVARPKYLHPDLVTELNRTRS
jgi:hypothetical protein